MDIAARIDRVEPSATLAISGLAKELRADGADVVDLSVGEPDFATPENIIAEAKSAMDAGHTGYTPSAGIPALRESIASKLDADGLAYDPDEIIVTPGAKQALYEVIQTLVDPGDEVVLLDPAWVSYAAMVKIAGGSLTRIDLTEHDFRLEPALDELAETISTETELVILNTPSNPTGMVYSDTALAGLADIVAETDTTVVSDEIYQQITYDAEPHSFGTYPGMDSQTITVNGFSKAYSMTGWRLGYFAAPTELVSQAAKLHSHSVSCATNFVQHAGVEALENTDKAVTEMVSAFADRRDFLVDRLTDAGVSVPAVPAGAFYLMVPVVGDDQVACTRALEEAHVATVPGNAFGAPGYARISYANTLDRIEEALDRLFEISYFQID